GPAAHDDLHGLPDPDGDGRAAPRYRPHGDAARDERQRLQGHGRGRHDRLDGRAGQRRGRRAGAARHRGPRAAADPGPRLSPPQGDTRMTRTKLTAVTALVALALASGGPPARAQERVKIRVAALTLPVFNPIIVHLMKEKGIDARHQLDMDVRAYPSMAAFYAALATGEADTT